MKYDGTLIVVSHDRDFLDGLVEKVYEFRDRHIREHIGGIYEFLQKKNLDSLKELNRKETAPQPSFQKPPPLSQNREEKENIKDSKENYFEKKEFDRQIRKTITQVADAEECIARIEREIETTEHLLATPEHLETVEIEEMSAHYKRLKTELDEAMEQWERLTAELEEMKS